MDTYSIYDIMVHILGKSRVDAWYQGFKDTYCDKMYTGTLGLTQETWEKLGVEWDSVADVEYIGKS